MHDMGGSSLFNEAAPAVEGLGTGLNAQLWAELLDLSPCGSIVLIVANGASDEGGPLVGLSRHRMRGLSPVTGASDWSIMLMWSFAEKSICVAPRRIESTSSLLRLGIGVNRRCE